MIEERTLAAVAFTAREAADESASLPRLSVEQAKFLSYAIEVGLERAAEPYVEAAGSSPPLEKWAEDTEYMEAVRLLGADRRLLWRAMTMTLFGPAYRALLIMIENPKTAPKGIELLSRTHGFLAEKVGKDEPGQIQQLLRALSENKPIPGPGQRYSIVEGEFRDAAPLPKG